MGAESIIDATAVDTPIFLRSSKPSNGTLAGSLVLQNIRLLRCRTAVGVVNAPDLVSADPEGEMCIKRWGQGNIYTGANGAGRFVQGPLPGSQVAPCLLDRHGKIVSRSRPQYEFCHIEQFVSVRAEGVVGDGVMVSYCLLLHIRRVGDIVTGRHSRTSSRSR